jgi:hypothetical protein
MKNQEIVLIRKWVVSDRTRADNSEPHIRGNTEACLDKGEIQQRKRGER